MSVLIHDTKLSENISVNVEYQFIAITPRSTLTWSGSTCLGLMHKSKRIVLLQYLKLTMCKKSIVILENVCKQMSLVPFKNVLYKQHIYK